MSYDPDAPHERKMRAGQSVLAMMDAMGDPDVFAAYQHAAVAIGKFGDAMFAHGVEPVQIFGQMHALVVNVLWLKMNLDSETEDPWGL